MTALLETECLKNKAFNHFISEFECLSTRLDSMSVGEEAKEIALTQGAGLLLRDLLHYGGRWLPEAFRQPAEDRYRQHILYVAENGAFSVVSLVWRPGQKTCIHNHASWCVVGVYQGLETETRYNVGTDLSGQQFLVEESIETTHAGQVGVLTPTQGDIHRVANASDGISISIHIYGLDVSKLGTSIKTRFDDLPIKNTVGNTKNFAATLLQRK